MVYLVQKLCLVKVVGVLLVLFFVVCSFDLCYKCQVSGDEVYLQVLLLSEFYVLVGMILLIQVGDYNILVVNSIGVVGKVLDICLLVQLLVLVSGVWIQFNGDIVMLMVENGCSGLLWVQVISIFQLKNYVIVKCDDVSQMLNIDWVEWNCFDEDQQYCGCY